MGTLAPQSIDPDWSDPDLNLDVVIEGVIGNGEGTLARYPIFRAVIGGALLRLVYETGRTPPLPNTFAAGKPSVSPSAVLNGSRFTLIPALSVHVMFPVLNGANQDNEYLRDTLDDLFLGVVGLDTAYSALTPALTSPTLQSWALAFGGSYTDIL